METPYAPSDTAVTAIVADHNWVAVAMRRHVFCYRCGAGWNDRFLVVPQLIVSSALSAFVLLCPVTRS